MIRVGVTGTLGAGKSAVGRRFASWGGERLDADRLAREAVAPGTPGCERIRAEWGERALGPDGAPDRAALRRLVAADPEARRRLEAIVHPEVARLRERRRRDAERRGVEVLVEEVPLLFEVGLEGEFDFVVAVDAPVETRRRRVTEGRGVTPEEFEAMDRAQMSGAEKRALADLAICNDGDHSALEREARRVWERILAEAGSGASPGGRRPPGGGPASGDEPSPGPDRWRVDLHAHTRASYDCLTSPADLVRVADERGLDRIAVTDHDEIDGALAARELASERVIVGEEVRTAEGLDLIGLFLERRIPPGAPLAEVADAIHEQGGVTYLPHPFDAHRGGDASLFDAVASRIDLVEGFNARVHDPALNRRAVAWAAGHGIPVGAGSDAHLLAEVGRGRILLDPFQGPRALIESARRGRIEGDPSGRWVHLGSTWARLRKRLV